MSISINIGFAFLNKNLNVFLRKIDITYPQIAFFNIARQMFTQNTACFMSSFRQAAEKTNRYIIVDNATKVNRKYQLRTNILPGEDEIVFVPTK